MRQKSLEELKANLKWIEETPFYIGDDGLPSGLLIFTGIIPTLLFRFIKKKLLKRKIAKLI